MKARQEASTLTESQAQAVAILLSDELQRERRPQLIKDVCLMLLGVLIGWVIQGGLPTWVPGI